VALAQQVDELRYKNKSDPRALDATHAEIHSGVLQVADVMCHTFGSGHEALQFQSYSSPIETVKLQGSLTMKGIDWEKIAQPHTPFQQYASRRSVVYGTKGGSIVQITDRGSSLLSLARRYGRLFSATRR